MSSASTGVRVVAAIGLMLLAAALVYAVTQGRLFLFPFLLLVGFPMAAVFRPRRGPPSAQELSPPPESPPPPPRISLN
jgi:hypothetical protein